MNSGLWIEATPCESTVERTVPETKQRVRYTLSDVWRYLKQRTGKQLNHQNVYDAARAVGIEPRQGNSGPTLTADDVEKVLMSYYEREALRAERGGHSNAVPRVRKVIAPKATAAPLGPPAAATRPGPRLPRK